jgi:hypothetical protein
MGLPVPRPAAPQPDDDYFPKWRNDCTDQTIHDLLHW